MVFSSTFFLLIFFPLTLFLYYISPKKIRNLTLFILSLIFYAWGEPIYVGLMIFSTLVDFYNGKKVEQYKEIDNNKKARFHLILSVIINLSLLGFFKYGDFMLGNINALFGLDIPLMDLRLPIGISFYTFQTMSYTIDIYRGQAKAQKSIISFGAYVALFPQLIAGPIVQYKTVAKQLVHRKETATSFEVGIKRFVCGLGKKVLLANNIGFLWSEISAMEFETLPVLTAWLGVVAISFQIYFDFSGYSDMAIGLGKMFGFTFLENFNYPYISRSVTEFWRRWHISLGTWFKEYVYIPLGGNRCSVKRQILNISVVWLLTGFWHGASWNFVLWGVYFGVLLIIEKLVLHKFLSRLPAVLAHAYTLFLVGISWVIFFVEDLGQMGVYLKSMFGLNGNAVYDKSSLYTLISNIFMIAILIFAATPLPKKIFAKINDKLYPIAAILIMLTFILSVAYLISASYNPFLYFRF